MRALVLPSSLLQELVAKATTAKNEFGGAMRGDTSRGLFLIKEFKLVEGSERKVNFLIPLADYILGVPNWNSFSEYDSVLLFHAHIRRIGEIIMPYDPYWSVGMVRRGSHNPGEGVGNFRICEHETGDSEAAEESKRCFHINYFLFLHPEYRTEGEVMTRKKMKATALRYDRASLGNVSEMPLFIS